MCVFVRVFSDEFQNVIKEFNFLGGRYETRNLSVDR